MTKMIRLSATSARQPRFPAVSGFRVWPPWEVTGPVDSGFAHMPQTGLMLFVELFCVFFIILPPSLR